MIWKMKKDKENNNTYTLPTGAKITIETDRKLIKKNVEKKKDKSKKNAVNLKDILEKQRGLPDELFIGGVDITKLEWMISLLKKSRIRFSSRHSTKTAR